MRMIKWDNVIALAIVAALGFAVRHFFGFEAAVILALAVLLQSDRSN